MLYAIEILKKEVKSLEEDKNILKNRNEIRVVLEEKISQIKLGITCLKLVENGLDPFENGAFIWEGYKKINSDG